MDIHMDRHGRGDRVLFIHGAGGSSASWRFQRKLQERCEVILLDLPGHGKSPGEGCREIDGYVERVVNVIQGTGLEGCYIAGHSMGGAIAVRLALDFPHLPAGLILVGTGARLRVFPRILEGILKDKEETVRAIIGFAFSKKAASALIDGVFAEMMATPKEVIYGDFLACDRVDMVEAVKSIRLPTLVIAGADDVLTPPKYSEYLVGAIGGSRLSLIPDAGHMVMLEKPEETNLAIESFITHR